jgi:KTSC domain
MARRFTPAISPRSRSGLTSPKTGRPESFAQSQARMSGGMVKNQTSVAPEAFYDGTNLGEAITAGIFDVYATSGRVRTSPFELDLDREGMRQYAQFAQGYDDSTLSSEQFDPKDVGSTGDAPAPLTVNPTSTLFPERPRTLAAGFKFNAGSQTIGKLTIMFRDGTLYNYYDVPESVWATFKAAPSKGRAILALGLNAYARGYAGAAASSGARQVIHKSSRVAQKTLHAQRPKASGTRTVQVRKQTRRRTR